MFSRWISPVLWGVALWLLTACGPTAALSQVTPLPEATSSLRSLPAPERPTTSPEETAPQPSPTPLLVIPAALPTHIPGALPPELADSLPTPATNLPLATPTPWLIDLAAGDAYEQVRAADVALQVTPVRPVTLPDSEPVTLSFDEFYVNFKPWAYELPEFSDKLLALDGRTVVIEGYMAPPLKLDLDWFQLTRVPIMGCIYCSGVGSWVPDIVQVYNETGALPFTLQPLRVVGELHVGESVDPETGMVSLIRIYAQDYAILEGY